MIRIWMAVQDRDRRAALIRMLRTDPTVRLVGSEAEADIVCREAEPVPVSALLRSSGRTERFSRTGRVPDVTELKRRRAARARQERAELDAVWNLLATGGPVRLSEFGRLDHATFERVLELLGRALAAAPGRGGDRQGVTSDGRLRIVLRPPGDAGTAVLRTPRGVFEGPDYLVEIEALDRPAGRTAREAAG